MKFGYYIKIEYCKLTHEYKIEFMEWRESEGNKQKAPKENINISFLEKTSAVMESSIYELTI